MFFFCLLFSLSDFRFKLNMSLVWGAAESKFNLNCVSTAAVKAALLLLSSPHEVFTASRQRSPFRYRLTKCLHVIFCLFVSVCLPPGYKQVLVLQVSVSIKLHLIDFLQPSNTRCSEKSTYWFVDGRNMESFSSLSNKHTYNYTTITASDSWTFKSLWLQKRIWSLLLITYCWSYQ